jgi:hypothetical protein
MFNNDMYNQVFERDLGMGERDLGMGERDLGRGDGLGFLRFLG